MKRLTVFIAGLFLFFAVQVCASAGEFQKSEEIEKMLELPDDYMAHLSDENLIQMKVSITGYRMQAIDYIAEVIVNSDFEPSSQEVREIKELESLAQECSLTENKIRLMIRIRTLAENKSRNQIAKKIPPLTY